MGQLQRDVPRTTETPSLEGGPTATPPGVSNALRAELAGPPEPEQESWLIRTLREQGSVADAEALEEPNPNMVEAFGTGLEWEPPGGWWVAEQAARSAGEGVKDWAVESTGMPDPALVPALWGGLHLRELMPEGTAVVFDNTNPDANLVNYDFSMSGPDSVRVPTVAIEAMQTHGITTGSIEASGIELRELESVAGPDGETHGAALDLPHVTVRNIDLGNGLVAESVTLTSLSATRSYTEGSWPLGALSTEGTTRATLGGMSIQGLTLNGVAIDEFDLETLSAVMSEGALSASAEEARATGVDLGDDTGSIGALSVTNPGLAHDGSTWSGSADGVELDRLSAADHTAETVTLGATSGTVDGDRYTASVASLGADEVHGSNSLTGGHVSGLELSGVTDGSATVVSVEGAGADRVNTAGIDMTDLSVGPAWAVAAEGSVEAGAERIAAESVDGPGVSAGNVAVEGPSVVHDGSTWTGSADGARVSGLSALDHTAGTVSLGATTGSLDGDRYAVNAGSLSIDEVVGSNSLTAGHVTGLELSGVTDGSATVVSLEEAGAERVSTAGIDATQLSVGPAWAVSAEGSVEAGAERITAESVGGPATLSNPHLDGPQLALTPDGVAVSADRAGVDALDVAGLTTGAVSLEAPSLTTSGETFESSVAAGSAETLAYAGGTLDALRTEGFTGSGSVSGERLDLGTGETSAEGLLYEPAGLRVVVNEATASGLTVDRDEGWTAGADGLTAAGVRHQEWVRTVASDGVDIPLIHQMAGLVQDADVAATLGITPGRYGEGALRSVVVEPGTSAHINGHVRDGALWPGAGVEMSQWLDGPLWTSGQGAYLTRNGQVNGRVGGLPLDPNLVPFLPLEGERDTLPMRLTDLVGVLPLETLNEPSSEPGPIQSVAVHSTVRTGEGTISSNGVDASVAGGNVARIQYGSQPDGRTVIGAQMAEVVLRSLGLDMDGADLDISGLTAAGAEYRSVDTDRGSTVSTTTVRSAEADRVRGRF